jgi:hypothetical protein
MATKVSIRPNGPYLVEGDVELIDVNGNKGRHDRPRAARRAVSLRGVSN